MKASPQVVSHGVILVVALLTLAWEAWSGFPHLPFPLLPLLVGPEQPVWLPVSAALVGWVVFLNGLLGFARRNVPPTPEEQRPMLAAGLAVSLAAGVVEELYFRFILFLAAAVWVFWLDALLGGALSWVQLQVVGPVFDVLTFRLLHGWLFHPAGFHVGLAVVLANRSFRRDHEGQGWFNVLNAAVLGFALFGVMVGGGLWAGMLTHVVYDAAMFATRAVTVAWRTRRAPAIQ